MFAVSEVTHRNGTASLADKLKHSASRLVLAKTMLAAEGRIASFVNQEVQMRKLVVALSMREVMKLTDLTVLALAVATAVAGLVMLARWL